MKGMKNLLAVTTSLVLCLSALTGCRTQDTASDLEEQNSEQEVSEQDTSEQDISAEMDATEMMNMELEDGRKPAYVWEDVILYLPDSWRDIYLTIEDENRIDFYQKASYEEDEGSGFLFGILRSEEWLSYYTSADRMIAYTDDGMMYYLVQPTDMPVNSEDENVLKEYLAMENQIPQIKSDIRINAAGVHFDASQYQIPVSSIKAIKQSDLVNMTDNQLWIARNEIYARHGKIFNNEHLQNYFNSCSWYTPAEGKREITEEDLSETEQLNLKQIVSMEKVWKEKHAYPKAYAPATEVKEHLLGTKEINTIVYKVTEQEESEYDYVLCIDDVEYDLKDYIYMVSPVTDVFYVTNLNDISGNVTEDGDGLEIAVLDDGPGNDPVTHFFKYDGTLHYMGEVSGFPFKEQNNGWNGFTNESGVFGTVRSDLIETAYLRGYWWYDSSNMKLIYTDLGGCDYEYGYLKSHELLMDIPLYTSMDTSADTVLLTKQEEIYFLQSDMESWILVRGKDGTEGYIFIEDGNIRNVEKPAEEVFADLAFFD